MADGFDIHLDSEQAARLKAAADVRGVSPSDYALAAIDQALSEVPAGFVDPDPAIDEVIADEVEQTGEAVSWLEFRNRLRKFGGHNG